jgi:CheY-like chemotaxis protein
MRLPGGNPTRRRPAELRECVVNLVLPSGGLGLPVCREILQRHGAEIRFESEEGQGTRAGFRPPRSAMPEAVPPPAGLAPGRGRVLVVDDDTMVRDVHTAALEQAGYQVAACAEGQQALAALAGSPFDLVLLDQRMPGLTGCELAARMEPRWPALPVILLSGYGEDVREQVRSANVRLVLRKPLGLQQLAEAVAAVLAAGPGPWPEPAIAPITGGG